jgi:NAD(P)-dependent dehydrogenase (short-subunit alcohol dehydrogenase family)
MLTFTNRTALITGAGRGIGKAIAETLAKQGVTVICVSKSADSCGATAAAINASGGKAKALAVDVADGAAIAKASEELLKEFPGDRHFGEQRGHHPGRFALSHERDRLERRDRHEPHELFSLDQADRPVR